MAWHEVDNWTLPVGVIAADKSLTRISIGAATVRAWRLRRFATATVLINSAPGLVAVHFYEGKEGKRVVTRPGPDDNTLIIRCAAVLRVAGAEHGRYLAHKDADGFLVIDFGNQLPPGWTPQAGR